MTEEAIDKIRERIVSGSWGPGDRLPKESELAAELGLSRNSLREAVRALSQLRVLEVQRPGRRRLRAGDFARGATLVGRRLG